MATPAASSKAYLLTEGGVKIPCLFNPADLSLSQSNLWTSKEGPGKGVPTLKFSGIQSGSLTLNLFFDTTDTGSAVTTYTDQLVALMALDTSLSGSSPQTANVRPQWVTFNWGDFHSYHAVVASLQLTFEYFSSTGIPLRARAAMTLTQYESNPAVTTQNPTSGTPHPHRVHRVQPGETLDRIAALHLGDSKQWRSIAEANGIEDPLALRPGSLLAIPGRF